MNRPIARWIPALAASLAVWGAWAQAPRVDGEVTKIDRATNRLTLRHGEIKSLDMPAMTMAYRVREPRMIEGLGVGDKVRFTAEKVDGYYTITSVSKLP